MDGTPRLTRRALLGTGAATLATLALPGCVTRRAATAACLPPPKLDDERIVRVAVGLRPFRERGFVVRAEASDGQRLVHNYGHGGGGITLSWGTAQLAADLGLPGHAGPVAVIGAGVAGLTTARLVQEAGFSVTVYAEHLPPDTTSDVAGGQWYPSLVFRRSQATPEFRVQLEAAAQYAHRRFAAMTGPHYGIRELHNYELYPDPAPPGPPSDQWLYPMMRDVRDLDPGEHPFGDAYVRAWHGLYVETPRFLQRLLDDVRAAGGVVVRRRFAERAELQRLPERLVFNCTGLGARELVGDTELQPVRGQLVLLKPQDELRYAVSAAGPEPTYLFPRADAVILGGTNGWGDWNLEPDPEITRHILARHRALFGSMERC